ncbi:MAG: hypothetical protein J6O40_06850, partial [Ruminococcus sp.]|nr:hypothetical protein [Ruminococcus sp.]
PFAKLRFVVRKLFKKNNNKGIAVRQVKSCCGDTFFYFYAKKSSAVKHCEDKIKKLCVEQKKGDNKTDVCLKQHHKKIHEYCNEHLTSYIL